MRKVEGRDHFIPLNDLSDSAPLRLCVEIKQLVPGFILAGLATVSSPSQLPADWHRCRCNGGLVAGLQLG